MNTLQTATRILANAGISTARLDALALMEYVTGVDRSQLLAGHELSSKQKGQYEQLIHQRTERVPLAYLVGYKEFYGRTFIVTPDTLIPRPESEDIIELYRSALNLENMTHILDLGTGSGCLGITAKYFLPSAALTLVDVSAEALTVAEANIATHDIEAKVVTSDLLTSINESAYANRETIILANLPYVPYEDLKTYNTNSPELVCEPEQALYSGSKGLGHYVRLFKQLKQLPRKPLVITEALPEQHTKLAEIARNSGYTLHESRGLAQLFIPTL